MKNEVVKIENSSAIMQPIKVPKATAFDVVHSLTKGALGAIPFVGALAGEALALAIQPPFQKRFNNWMSDVSARLVLISEEQGIDVENLINDERILSAIFQATEIAVRTHEKVKRAALLEAVTASASSVNITLEGLFFNFLGSFQVHHLRLLMRIHQNSILGEEQLESNALMTQFVTDELEGNKGLMSILTEELGAYRQLYSYENDETTLGRHYLYLTPLGQQFIEFIGNEKMN